MAYYFLLIYLKQLKNHGELQFLTRIISLFFVAVFPAVMSTADAAWSDVPTTHRNFEAITFLHDRGIIEGYGDNTFRPDQDVNRAETLKIILLGTGIGETPLVDKTRFRDVSPNDWFAGFVQAAVDREVVQGYPDNTFKPDRTVNLVEALKILFLANFIDIAGVEIDEIPFRDAYAGEWYIRYLLYADNHGLIEADSRNNIYPARAITRGQLSEIIYRLINLYRGMMPIQKLRAEEIINVFEHGTTEIKYATSYTLDDGRGITSGNAGFTTATGDAYEVVKRYTNRKPDNPLANYLTELKRLAEARSGDVSGLAGYPKAWADAAKDSFFISVQDEVTDEYYFRPAMESADEQGLILPLSRAVLYDTVIQHGDGADPDGLQAIIDMTNGQMSGSPGEGIDETSWLEAFLNNRIYVLTHATEESTREAWASSVGRCEVFLHLLSEGNVDLEGPIVINTEIYHGTTH